MSEEKEKRNVLGSNFHLIDNVCIVGKRGNKAIKLAKKMNNKNGKLKVFFCKCKKSNKLDGQNLCITQKLKLTLIGDK